MRSASIVTAAERPEFVDSNVLLYAHDRSEVLKQPIAATLLARLWRDRTGVLSTQVLQEFYHVATQRLRSPISRAVAREVVERYSAWPVVLIEPATIVGASMLQERHRVSFWDALIVQAAVIAGAGTLLTEDLSAGEVIGGVRVVNPFAVG